MHRVYEEESVCALVTKLDLPVLRDKRFSPSELQPAAGFGDVKVCAAAARLSRLADCTVVFYEGLLIISQASLQL